MHREKVPGRKHAAARLKKFLASLCRKRCIAIEASPCLPQGPVDVMSDERSVTAVDATQGIEQGSQKFLPLASRPIYCTLPLLG